MSFINMNLSEIKEAQVAPKGTYVLMIDSIEKHEKEIDGVKREVGRKVSLSFEEHPEFESVSHWLSFPQPEDDAGKAKMKMRMLKRFLLAFGIPFSEEGFNDEDFPGCRAKIEVTLESYQKDGSAEVQVSNRLSLPRFE